MPSWTQRRKDLMFEIIKKVRLADNGGLALSKEFLISTLDFDHGVSRRKTLEYLNSLENLGKIVINNDNIKLPGGI